jgi:drug/metabolite transporter (DMT)-like permease
MPGDEALMRQNSPINRSMGLGEWTMLIGLSVLWGGSFFFNGVAIKELPVFTVVVSRIVLAALILLAVMRITGRKMPGDARLWRAFFGLGLINNAIPFSLIVWGQSHIASGVASILNATTPLFTVIIAHYFTGDEKMSWNRLLGVLIGFAGVVIMIGSDTLHALGVNVFAQLAVLLAALCYAISGVFARRFRAMGISPIATATGQLTASSIILLPVLLIVDRPWTLPMPGMATIAALFAVASLSTALAYILYFRILASSGATNVLLVTFLVPVSAILLGVFVLGEVLYLKHFLGMAMIGAGLAAIDGRLPAMMRRIFSSRLTPKTG